MLNIQGRFRNRRSRAFLKFLAEAKTMRGYQQTIDTDGKIIHSIDFYERDFIKIVGGFGSALEKEWEGWYLLDGKVISLTRLWQRHLRDTDVMDRTVCPSCGTALGKLPLCVNFVVKSGFEVDYTINCVCGADITGLYNIAHAISTSETPAELIKKSRGEA